MDLSKPAFQRLVYKPVQTRVNGNKLAAGKVSCHPLSAKMVRISQPVLRVQT